MLISCVLREVSILRDMAKETVFNKYKPNNTNLVGYIIIHPTLGSGIITAFQNPSTLDDSGVYTILWSNQDIEDVTGKVIRESRIINGDETF